MPTSIRIKLKPARDESHRIIIGRNLLKNIHAHLGDLSNIGRLVIITDSAVGKLYGERLRQGLKAANLPAYVISFPAGERNKNQKTVFGIVNKMLKLGCGRDTLIFALGGGVVGDVAGFVAAIYMRGIPFIQVPTTLLAMVDSSIGGKTGIDLPAGKNLVGAFNQPRLIITDIDTLSTLPRRQLFNGLFEAIKTCLVCDAKGFRLLEKNLKKFLDRDADILEMIIKRAIKNKSKVVERDALEKNERAILNFGHTIGHTLERLSGYQLEHGRAVGLGMLAESKLAANLGYLPRSVCGRIISLLEQCGIVSAMLKNFSASQIISAMNSDKKQSGGKKRVVLLADVGEVFIKNGVYAQEVTDGALRKILD